MHSSKCGHLLRNNLRLHKKFTGADELRKTYLVKLYGLVFRLSSVLSSTYLFTNNAGKMSACLAKAKMIAYLTLEKYHFTLVAIALLTLESLQ